MIKDALNPIAELEARAAKADRGTETLLVERRNTHGAFVDNARLSQAIKTLMHAAPGWPSMTDVQREALEMIALKLSRILSGQASFGDHWLDVAGYSTLVVKDLSK
jgi:hypothetical protein